MVVKDYLIQQFGVVVAYVERKKAGFDPIFQTCGLLLNVVLKVLLSALKMLVRE